VFERWRTDRAVIGAARLVRDRTAANSVVLSLVNSGSLQYYAGRATLRWDLLDPAWLDRAVAWLADRHVRAYAMLDDAEVSGFRERFAGQTVTKLIDVPVLVYQGATTLRLYDLGRRDTVPAVPETVTESFRDSMRCVTPAVPARLTFVP
jgi:hypothetical protein